MLSFLLSKHSTFIFMHTVLFQRNIQFSDRCNYNSVVNYTVVLRNGRDSPIEHQISSTSDRCNDFTCSTTITVSNPRSSYQVSVSAVSIVGESISMFPSSICKSADIMFHACHVNKI